MCSITSHLDQLLCLVFDKLKPLTHGGGGVYHHDNLVLQQCPKQLPATTFQPLQSFLTLSHHTLHILTIHLVGVVTQLNVNHALFVQPIINGISVFLVRDNKLI